ncbi:CAP-associated domain-containing protein [Enterococcus saccharolyticus]|uniref:CAP-associated domain-containing protein n=1 Tax=Enterococcus saccharolyticus subsp. saccharolyticus ATCC 43076 TaxID=1139996 RepID=S0NWQ2_9ENTE|nr:CAP-associated domain-containing protein [Enterococcus saccharolyticus]EOT29743.1 hypothetical protein OMQ_01056 [Enterococcus saccharolyticus subsp. saccharolyticus ATCC 43076]EOT80903.1 hypothetical protein I572_01435 [Enterococcus saccharolyticus subsp. saccharolyticus ATCC 43076]
MKHRGILFSVIFIGCIFLLYMYPVWFPQVSSDPSNKNEIRREPPATSWNYEPIATDGFAKWIGQKLADFETVYGNPEEVYSSGFSFVIHRYTIDDQTYVEVNTEDKRITSIKFLGKENDTIAPFRFGMTMNELAKITMIYPNFTLNYEGKTIAFELMEDDMNYRPLIAFDNRTFAILFFSQKKGESSLYSVMYLDKETLLKLAPYQVTDGVSPRFTTEETADWEVINQNKQEQSKYLFQFLRNYDRLPEFILDAKNQMLGEQILGGFFAKTEEFLTTERTQQLKRIQNGTEDGRFTLSRTEMEDVLKEFSTDTANVYLELPVYDPMFTILTWYSTPYLHTRFMHQEPESLGIAFSKENVVVLLQQLENKTEDSDAN